MSMWKARTNTFLLVFDNFVSCLNVSFIFLLRGRVEMGLPPFTSGLLTMFGSLVQTEDLGTQIRLLWFRDNKCQSPVRSIHWAQLISLKLRTYVVIFKCWIILNVRPVQISIDFQIWPSSSAVQIVISMWANSLWIESDGGYFITDVFL